MGQGGEEEERKQSIAGSSVSGDREADDKGTCSMLGLRHRQTIERNADATHTWTEV